MIILQTLGRHGGDQEGIFGYVRGSAGVTIDSSVGHAKLVPSTITIMSDEWRDILVAIEQKKHKAFRLTGKEPFSQPPRQCLYQLLGEAVPNPKGPWNWRDSWRAYVWAILEHEGRIDICHVVSALKPTPSFVWRKTSLVSRLRI